MTPPSPPPARLAPSSGIRCKTIDGAVVILDIRSGSYHVLDPVATAMWDALLARSRGVPGAIAALEREFDVDPQRLRSDLDAFERRCVEAGFLGPAGPAPRLETLPHSRVVLPAWNAWWCLVQTVGALRWRGFARTYRAYMRLARPAVRAPRPDLLRRAVRAFSIAENFCPLRRAPKDCLPRSLALFRFLRNMGLPAEHCIGVHRTPFLAHAWVECAGEVVLDLDRRPEFVTLARIGG